MTEPEQDKAPKQEGMSGKQMYNVVSDTVTGLNVRRRDNRIQGVIIAASIPVGSIIGLLVTRRPADGVIFGGFFGLLAGLFGSGIFLMIYRAVKHIGGDHD